MGACAAVCLTALAEGLRVNVSTPSAHAVGYSLANHIGGSTVSAPPCRLPTVGAANCSVWDAENSGRTRYSVTRNSRGCWRAERVAGGVPERPMRRRGSACVTLGDRISTQPASTAVVGGLAVAAIVFFGAMAWLMRRFGGLGGSTALG